MDKYKLAEWLHDNYEQLAKANDWQTQEITRVKFEDLPTENKSTMLALADKMLNTFLIISANRLVSGSLPPDAIDALLKTSQAYQGVGDFESTGENMVSVIGDVRKVLSNHGIDWRQ